MALITESSDPNLWNALKALREKEGGTAWVVTQNRKHYRAVQTVDGNLAFVEKDKMGLVDSRSFTDSKPTTYSKLDPD